MNASEIIFEDTLAEWWNSRGMPPDRWFLLRNCSISEQKTLQLSRREWKKLPVELRRLLVTYARSGRSLEFLPND